MSTGNEYREPDEDFDAATIWGEDSPEEGEAPELPPGSRRDRRLLDGSLQARRRLERYLEDKRLEALLDDPLAETRRPARVRGAPKPPRGVRKRSPGRLRPGSSEGPSVH